MQDTEIYGSGLQWWTTRSNTEECKRSVLEIWRASGRPEAHSNVPYESASGSEGSMREDRGWRVSARSYRVCTGRWKSGCWKLNNLQRPGDHAQDKGEDLSSSKENQHEILSSCSPFIPFQQQSSLKWLRSTLTNSAGWSPCWQLINHHNNAVLYQNTFRFVYLFVFLFPFLFWDRFSLYVVHASLELGHSCLLSSLDCRHSALYIALECYSEMR